VSAQDDRASDFLDRAAIAFVAAGMESTQACVIAERLLEMRMKRDADQAARLAAERAEQQRIETERLVGQAARLAAERAEQQRIETERLVGLARAAAERLSIGDRVPGVGPGAEDAFTEALAARGLAVWDRAFDARIVSKAEVDEAERLERLIAERRAEKQAARDRAYQADQTERDMKTWAANLARLRAEARHDD
jgi:hypothetical protein